VAITNRKSQADPRQEGTGAKRQRAAFSLAVAWLAAAVAGVSSDDAGAASLQRTPILSRHVDITREAATPSPNSEQDQAIVDGWPLYRTERGQEAFNHAMATMRATDSARPRPEHFAGCEDLHCNLALPRLTESGWIPAGRLWLAPDEYLLIVHSPRRNRYDPGSRRDRRTMRFFVFHEFHNSTGNTDVYDTISSHSRSVFVPFYLSKQRQDARGNRYVVLVQVAPHDVVSRHAANLGNAGPGIEVAKNVRDPLAPLQAKAGVLVAGIVKSAEPHLRIVNHRGSEGRPMLNAYMRRVAALRRARDAGPKRLPFVPAKEQRVASATGGLGQLIAGSAAVANGSPLQRPPVFATARIMPKLIEAPRLVRIIRRPVLTMNKLIESVMAAPVPPKPQPACREAPNYVCSQSGDT